MMKILYKEKLKLGTDLYLTLSHYDLNEEFPSEYKSLEFTLDVMSEESLEKNSHYLKTNYRSSYKEFKKIKPESENIVITLGDLSTVSVNITKVIKIKELLVLKEIKNTDNIDVDYSVYYKTEISSSDFLKLLKDKI